MSIINKSLPACSYCRVSTDVQDYQRQVDTINEKALAYNYHIIKEFAEKESGKKKVRPELTNLLNFCKTNNVKYVVISELSRIGRSEEVLNTVNTLSSMNVCLISLKENIKSLNENGTIDEHSRMFIGILTSLAGYDLSNIHYNTTNGLRTTAKAGNWTGGNNLPFGYMRETGGKKLVICDSEANTVKEIYEMYNGGKGCNQIATILNGRSIPTRQNKRWSHGVVYQILTNTLYKGERHYKDIIINAPAIIDTDVFDRIQKTLNEKSKLMEINKKYEYLLNKKILTCGVCGKSYFAKKQANGQDNCYKCVSGLTGRGCDNFGIKIEKLEIAVKYIYYKELSNLVQLPENLDLKDKEQEKNAYEIELKKLNSKELKFLDLYGNDKISEENLTIKIDEIKKTRQDLLKNIEGVTKYINEVNEIQNNLSDLNLKLGLTTDNAHVLNLIGKAEYLRQVVKSIIIHPDNTIHQTKQDKCIKVTIQAYNGTNFVAYLSQRSDYFIYENQQIKYGFDKKLNTELSKEDVERVKNWTNKMIKV